MLPVPEYAKDVVIALLGAAVGVAGLLLVVSGFVFSQASSFPGTTDDELLDRYERAGKLGLVPFTLALVDAGFCLGWFEFPSRGLYAVTVWGFLLVLVLTALYGFVLILRYL